MKKLILVSLVLVGCGSHFSEEGGYNISGVGLVPEKKICYDTTFILSAKGGLVITEKKCPTGDYNWDY